MSEFLSLSANNDHLRKNRPIFPFIRQINLITHLLLAYAAQNGGFKSFFFFLPSFLESISIIFVSQTHKVVCYSYKLLKNILICRIRLHFVNNHLSQSQHRILLADKRYFQSCYWKLLLTEKNRMTKIGRFTNKNEWFFMANKNRSSVYGLLITISDSERCAIKFLSPRHFELHD